MEAQEVEDVMEKKVAREKKLDAFTLDINDLERLWAELLAQFDDPDDVSASFEIESREETLVFKSIEEIKQYAALPGRITEYSFRLIQGNRFVHLHSGDLLDRRAVIRATTSEVGWCAGVTETAVSFLRKYRVWYRWIYSGLGKFILSLTLAVLVLDFLSEQVETNKLSDYLAVLFASSLFIYFYLGFFTKRLLPASVIRTSEKEGFVRRRGTEIVLIFTVIGVFIAAITLWIQL